MIVRVLTVLIAMLMLVGNPAMANSDCAAMRMSSGDSAHACCGGESACCKSTAPQSASAITNCSCVQNSQSAALSSLSLKLNFEEFFKIAFVIATIFLAYLAVKVTAVLAFSDRWRPPKVGLFLFYRVIKI